MKKSNFQKDCDKNQFFFKYYYVSLMSEKKMYYIFKMFIMRTVLIFFCSFLMTFVVYAQNDNSQNRDISLQILNKRGRPVKNIVVQSRITGKAGITDNSGLYVFEDISDNDTLSVRLGNNSQVVVPVRGMDYIVVKAISARFYSYFDRQNGDDDNNSVTVRKLPMSANDNIVMDVPSMLKQRSYGSLVELLSGQVAGLNISSDGRVAPMGGPNSINNTREPLVVLDGIEIGTLANANSMVSIHSIKTIEVQKNASGYGVRGASGVIVIKTQ